LRMITDLRLVLVTIDRRYTTRHGAELVKHRAPIPISPPTVPLDKFVQDLPLLFGFPKVGIIVCAASLLWSLTK
jgi:hypothetical protein